MNDKRMKIPILRPIVKFDGKLTQRDIFMRHILRDDPNENETTSHVSGIPINHNQVPLLVSQKQFDVINFRRQIRVKIEESRLLQGRPLNGRRLGTFKYIQKHLHAQKRARDSTGVFVSTSNLESPAIEDLHVYSICN